MIEILKRVGFIFFVYFLLQIIKHANGFENAVIMGFALLSSYVVFPYKKEDAKNEG